MIRQLALDETIDERLIEQEAEKKGLSKSNTWKFILKNIWIQAAS